MTPTIHKITIESTHRGIQLALRALAGAHTVTQAPSRPAGRPENVRKIEVVVQGGLPERAA